MKELYTQCWRNTGMPEQVTYVYHTEEPDGKLRDAIGDVVAVSYDMQRQYTIKSYAVAFRDFLYYADLEVDQLNEEDDFYEHNMSIFLYCFVDGCEDVFTKGRVEVPFKDVAHSMMAMSDKFKFGWKMREATSDDGQPCWRVYSKTIADMMYLDEDVIFCFSEESLVKAMREESISSFCDFKKHPVIIECPSGKFDEDEAYVIIRDKLTMRAMRKEV